MTSTIRTIPPKTVASEPQLIRPPGATLRNGKSRTRTPGFPFFPKCSNRLRAGDFLQVDLDARAHGRADRDLVDELALGARRPRLVDRVHERAEIGLQVFLGEAGLADP